MPIINTSPPDPEDPTATHQLAAELEGAITGIEHQQNPGMCLFDQIFGTTPDTEQHGSAEAEDGAE